MITEILVVSLIRVFCFDILFVDLTILHTTLFYFNFYQGVRIMQYFQYSSIPLNPFKFG